MKRLNPEQLRVTYLTDTSPKDLVLPRRYTLTHSDRTGELFLSISSHYDTNKISGLYTKLMRDEVLAEIVYKGDNLVFNVYCYVSGGFVFGTARWRYNIFQHELPLALEAIRYGDRTLFENIPDLDEVQVQIHFQSANKMYSRIENWGTVEEYK